MAPAKQRISRFLAECLRKMGHEVLCLREPGGTAIGEALRSIVLNPENSAMSDQAELLIYEAAHCPNRKETIIPALARGAVVLLDRFYDSTVAYQAYGRVFPYRLCIRPMCSLAKGCILSHHPAYITEAPAEEGLERATHHGDADRLEQAGADFHARVNSAFMRIAAENPSASRVVSSAGSKDETARTIFRSFPISSAGMPRVLCGSPDSSNLSSSVIPIKSQDQLR